MKKLAICLVLGIAFLVPAIVAFYQVENYRGRKAWAAYQKDVTQRGESLDFADFIRPEIPDDQNFAATPFFQALFDGETSRKRKIDLKAKANGRTKPYERNWSVGRPTDLASWESYFGTDDLRGVLAEFEPVLTEIAVAGRRPKTRFPLKLEDGAFISLPHLPELMSLSDLLVIRARVALAEQRENEAEEDIILTFRLAESVREQPFLIHFLIEPKILEQGIRGIWNGLALQQWKRPTFSALQRDFASD